MTMRPEARGARIPRGAIVLLLSAIYAVNYIDRQILAIILEHIKHEFRVSDTLLGLLVGPAFALFYATLGMPIALAADRMSRSRIIIASLACFSAMTLACGLVARFWQLVVARMLTGVGEAGTGPASQSIISDLYGPSERATAQAIYATGVNVGLMIAFFAGGWIADAYGWRAAFVAAGVPGLLLTLLAMAVLRDPPRPAPVQSPSPTAARLGFLWRQRSYRYIVLGTAMSAFSGYGITAFVPAFLIRSHGMGSTEVGLTFALIVGLGGGLGTYASGRFADIAARRGGIHRNLLAPAIAAVISIPFWVPFFLAGNVAVAIAAAVIPVSLSAAFIGPCIATIQTITPPAMRARAAAIQLFVGNLIGLGLGPLVIGVLSDLLRPVFGADSLRYAMFAGVAAAVASIPFYLVAARHVPQDLERLDGLD
ncbi:putative MFS family arabinose efflux permease [Sphingomonas leidyi]|uniref:Putative MFS family arabinose efflux permease n=1 Tax=Sphingomonas leidyi TaxID=68569 RepID=A0A7X5ZUG7_9SPHN|nr:MFS transporter [Sphingomonas leidyi]NIJ64062.1 putative MFS family arabinose efflux permease [Sphingomonas leidyi]